MINEESGAILQMKYALELQFRKKIFRNHTFSIGTFLSSRYL